VPELWECLRRRQETRAKIQPRDPVKYKNVATPNAAHKQMNRQNNKQQNLGKLLAIIIIIINNRKYIQEHIIKLH